MTPFKKITLTAVLTLSLTVFSIIGVTVVFILGDDPRVAECSGFQLCPGDGAMVLMVVIFVGATWLLWRWCKG